MLDTKITHARIVDGTGAPAYDGDIGILWRFKPQLVGFELLNYLFDGDTQFVEF